MEESEIYKIDLKNHRITNPTHIFALQFGALTLKRARCFKRDKRGLFCELFLPIIVTLIGALFTQIDLIIEHEP